MKLQHVTLIAFALIGAGELAHSEHLYYADGKEVNLTVCDSLLVIQLNQTAQVRDSSLIALERPELRDDFTPRSLAYGFYIYGLTPGADVAAGCPGRSSGSVSAAARIDCTISHTALGY